MRPAVAAVVFACLLLTLAATSSPRVVGDGSEYVHLAARLASGHLPAPASRGTSSSIPPSRPLLALGLTAAAAFTLLNDCCWPPPSTSPSPASTGPGAPSSSPARYSGGSTSLTPNRSRSRCTRSRSPCSSPRPGGASWRPGRRPRRTRQRRARRHPGRGGRRRRTSLLKDRRFWMGLAAAAALAALHPAYYLVRLGTPARLAFTGDPHWMTLRST